MAKPFTCPNCGHHLRTLETPLTERQYQVLTFVRRYRAAHGISPTLREICAALGLRSQATVCQHLGYLERKGLVQRAGMRYRRNLQLLG